MNMKNLQVSIGDTLAIPPELHGLEKKSNAIGEVVGIYPYVITLKQKNGIKFSINRNDLENYKEKGIEVVSFAAGNTVEELSDDILNNI